MKGSGEGPCVCNMTVRDAQGNSVQLTVYGEINVRAKQSSVRHLFDVLPPS